MYVHVQMVKKQHKTWLCISLDFDESHETNSNVYFNLNIKQSCILSKQIVLVESPSTLKIDRNNFLLEATNYNIS